jgi:hypothetical protein
VVNVVGEIAVVLVGVMLKISTPVALFVSSMAIVGLPPSDVSRTAEDVFSRTCMRNVHPVKLTAVPEASLYVTVTWKVLPRSIVAL